MMSPLGRGQLIDVFPAVATRGNSYDDNREYLVDLVANDIYISRGKRTRGICSGEGIYSLFDGKPHTSFKTVHPPYRPKTIGHMFRNNFPYEVKVTKYKIVVPAGTRKAKYPRSWIVWGWKLNKDNGKYDRVALDRVKNADFDRVYKGKIANPGQGYDRIGLEIRDDNSPEDAPKLTVEVAEIRYFGPKNQFDKHIEGGLQCKRAPQYPPRRRLMDGTPFSNGKIRPVEWPLRNLFDRDGAGAGMVYPDANEVPLIVGIVFNSPIEALQFGFDGLFDTIPPSNESVDADFDEKMVVIEGHSCDPSCDELGDDGWEVLASGYGREHYANKWLVKYPGAYKGYRVKIFRSAEEYGYPGLRVFLNEMYLIVCN